MVPAPDNIKPSGQIQVKLPIEFSHRPPSQSPDNVLHSSTSETWIKIVLIIRSFIKVNYHLEGMVEHASMLHELFCSFLLRLNSRGPQLYRLKCHIVPNVSQFPFISFVFERL